MTFKEHCIALRKQDKSIIEIMEITGRPKTSVYEYIKDIPLSKGRIEKNRLAAGKWIKKFAIARKGKSERSFRTFDKWSTGSVLMVAHFLFDGEIARVRCVYNNRSEALLKRVEDLMREWYDFEPSRYQNPLTGVRRISYHNVALGAYLQHKSVELLRLIKTMPLALQREFVRAFFDDEGCMDFRPGRSRIRGYQKDVRILRLIKRLLNNFSIEARIQLPNEVVVVGKENLIKFEREINFSSGVYINGNRSNSIWKKHLEKRQLLRMAIESFKINS